MLILLISYVIELRVIYKMRKKGDVFTTSNLLALVIAAIGIALLVVVGDRILEKYQNQDSKNAQKLLDSIIAKINALDEGEENSFTFIWVKDWRLAGYNEDENRPEKCLGACLCICPPASKISNFPNILPEQISLCQDRGFCRNVEFDNVDLRIRNVITFKGENCIDWPTKKPFGFYGQVEGVIEPSKGNILEDTSGQRSVALELIISKNSNLSIKKSHYVDRKDVFGIGTRVVEENGKQVCYGNYPS